MASFVTSAELGANVYSDGFYTGYGITVEENGFKTNGISDINNSSVTKKRYVSFVTTGAGTIKVKGKTGTTGLDRLAFVAKASETSVLGYDIVGRFPMGAEAEASCNLPSAGTYYLICSANVKITGLSVNYDETISTKELTPLPTDPAEATTLDPMEFYPKTLANNETFGKWKVAGSNSTIIGKGERSISGSKAHSMIFNIPSGDGLIFAAAASGTVLVYARAEVAADATGAITIVDGDSAAVTVTNGTIPSVDNADSGKTFSNADTVSFNVEANKTYKITCDKEISVFLANFNAA